MHISFNILPMTPALHMSLFLVLGESFSLIKDQYCCIATKTAQPVPGIIDTYTSTREEPQCMQDTVLEAESIRLDTTGATESLKCRRYADYQSAVEVWDIATIN